MSVPGRRSLCYRVEPLEPRLLLSAAWAAVLAPPWSDDAGSGITGGDDLWLPPADDHGPDVTAPAPLDLLALGELHAYQDTPARVELVVVDAAVEGYEQLLADITNRGDSVRYSVHVIDADSDGVAALSALLAGFDELAAVHIVSHGDAGGIQLGNTWLDSASVAGYANAIGDWSSALAEDADLLVYGCNLAGTADGQQLVGTLAALTGADVAASSDVTGQAALGGDWIFEHEVGTVQTNVAFSATLQANWAGVLAAFIVNTEDDTVDINPGDGRAEDAAGNTSLRAAIMEANALPGADFIQLPAGDYDLLIPTDITNFAASGDLDILDDLALVGEDAATTRVDANELSRIFDVHTGASVSISGVTVEGGGNVPVGGGIQVQSGAELWLYEVVVQDNTESINRGGGIYNAGTLYLNDVTLAFNDVSGDGGGLFNEGAANLSRVTFYGNDASRGGGIFQAAAAFGDLSLSNVTVSSNSANSGGGVYTQQATLIIDSTVTNNAATFGGGVVKESGPFSLQLGSSIIAGNSAFTSDDVAGDFTSLGYNLIGDGIGSNNLTDGVNNDQVGSLLFPIDPMLGGLQNNGGYVLTHALLAGSAAIDAGDPSSPSAYDARVAARDFAPDIGAYELNGTVNFTPTATNLNQALLFLEDDIGVNVAPIVVTETDPSDTINATLTLANPAAGTLTASSGNGETYTAATGVWTVSGDVAAVNAALADLSFTPAVDSVQGSYITTTIRDASGHGPPTGLILLDATPVNDAPDVVLLGAQVVIENSGLHTIPGFAIATPGGGPDEAGQTFSFLVGTTNAALFSVAPAIDASGTLTYTLNPGVTGTATVTVKAQDSGGVANGGTDTSPDRTFDITVLADGAGTSLLFSTDGDLSGIGSPGIDTWGSGHVVAFGDPGLSLGADAATSGEFGLQFRLDDFGPDQSINGMHFVSSGMTVGSGAGEFTLQAGDLLLTFNGGGDRTYSGTTTSITVQENDVFVFRPQAPGDYANGEFYYLLDNPLNDSVRGVALVESAAVTVGDGPALVQGTFLLSEQGPGDHDNIYTYLPLTVGDGNTTSTLGRQLLVNAEGAGNLNFSDEVQGIHVIEQATIIGGISFLPGDLLLTLNQDQDGAGEGVGTNRLQVSQNDVFRLRLSETHQGPNGRSTGVADMIFDGSSVSLNSNQADLDALTLLGVQSNVAPAATNLDQVLNYTEDAALVDLADIVVTDADSGDTIIVLLTLADTATGTLTAGSGNGESYDSGTGIWTVTGTVAEVNAALAAVAFVPGTNNAVSTSIASYVEDVGGLGPADGVITLNVTAVNDAPSFTLGPNQNVLEDSGPHTVAGFAAALPGGGADEAGQTFFYTVLTDNPGLFLVAPTIDASGTLTYTLNANANGTARITVTVTDSGGTANGGVDTSPAQFFDIVVAPVNDAPTLVIGGNQTVLEDSGFHSVAGFASALPGGGADEAGQNLTYSVTPDNAALFAVGPAIDASGTLTYTLNANANGTTRITVTVTDSGGTANGGVDTSPAQFFDIVVTATALPASATAVNLDQALVYLEDAGRVEFDDIAISGLADSALVTATLTLADTGTGQLSAASGNGESFDVVTGIWRITGTVGQVNAALADVGFVTVADNTRSTSVAVAITYPPGNTPAAGVIRLDVTAVNDAPSFVLLDDQVVLEDAGSQQLAGFASAVAGGGADEAGQVFTYRVDTDNPALFAVAPTIDSNGMLTYTLAENVSGSTLLTVVLTDSGGLASGGQNGAPAQTIMLDVLPVNDAPAGRDANVNTFENIPYVFALDDFGFSDVADGDAFAAIQVTFVPEGAGTLFQNGRVVLAGDKVDASTIAAGGLVFLPQNGVAGAADGLLSAVASMGFRVQDNGGIASGGVDTDLQSRRISISLIASGNAESVSPSVTSVNAPAPQDSSPEAPPPVPVVEAEADVNQAVTIPEQETPVVDAPLREARVVDIQPVAVFSEQVVPLVDDLSSAGATVRDTDAGERAPERVVAAVPEVLEWQADLTLEPDELGRQSYYVADSATALNLDRIREDMREDINLMRFEVGQTAGAMVGLSVGYVSWLLRGGVLLSSVLSSVPTWRFIDPLPVFSSVGSREEDEDGESLEAIVQAGADGERHAVIASVDSSHSAASHATMSEHAGNAQTSTGNPS